MYVSDAPSSSDAENVAKAKGARMTNKTSTKLTLIMDKSDHVFIMIILVAIVENFLIST